MMFVFIFEIFFVPQTLRLMMISGNRYDVGKLFVLYIVIKTYFECLVVLMKLQS